MATYLELHSLTGDQDQLLHRVMVAVIIKANALSELQTPTPEQKAFARLAYEDPRAIARQVLFAVLAKNASATVTQIKQVLDAPLQTHVNAAIDAIFVG